MDKVISIPVADLRDKPDGELVSQLRQGERVRILEQGEWLLVEALDQTQFTDSWHGYRGWMRASAVTDWRQTVLDAAHDCLGWRYLWGGLGDGAIDCSGLAHLAYRSAGIAIPRDACDQARHFQQTDNPQPADLLFMAKREAPDKIVHVMLYAGDDQFLEATSYSDNVRRVDLATRLSQPRPDYWHHFYATLSLSIT